MSTARFLHPSLPRRPARTSQADHPSLRAGVVFSHIDLHESGTRTIVGKVERGAPRIEVVLAFHIGGRTFRIYPDQVEVFERAVCDALNGEIGRHEAGYVDFGKAHRLRVWARVAPTTRLVCFARVDLCGEQVGKLTTLAGDEVHALGHALDWLVQQTKNARSR